MLDRLQTVANASVDFAFETTLAARTFAPFLQTCKTRGYTINLIYFWLRSPDLAVERVARRVASGGHSIPEDVIRRRYDRGRRNLINLYLVVPEKFKKQCSGGITACIGHDRIARNRAESCKSW
jgi:predicted ABC-type ATPase